MEHSIHYINTHSVYSCSGQGRNGRNDG